MTYGLEWNSKASRGEAVRSKRLDSQLELFDLPAELLVIILKSLGYDELRSLEVSCSYLRMLIIEHRIYSRLYKSLPYYNKQTLNCLHWLESNRDISNNRINNDDISRLCKKKLHQYHYQDRPDLLIVTIKILHLGVFKRKMNEIL